MSVRGARLFALDFFVLLAILVFGSWFLSWNALQRFDFYDMSSFLDAGYRVYRGQKIYSDFAYLAGPIHPYMHALFFKLFGFNKMAIQAHLCVISGIMVSLSYFLARRNLGIWISALLALVVTFSYYGPISHPWYDQNAWFWILCSVIILGLKAPFHSEKESQGVSFFLGAFVALAFFTKSNIGSAGGLAIAVSLFFCRFPVRSCIACLIGFIFFALLICLSLKAPGEFFYQTFIAYFPISRISYGAYRYAMRQTPHGIIAGVGVLLAVLGGRDFFKKNIVHWVLLIVLCNASLFAAFTSSVVIKANIPALGIELILMGILVSQLPRCLLARVGFVSMVFLFLLFSILRSKQLLTWGWRPSNAVLDYVMKNESMKGWKCNRRQGEGVDQAIEFIQQHIPKGDSFFIFPDATMIYGLVGRESYRNIPFLFHVGFFPPPESKVLRQFQETLLTLPPQWILMHNIFEMPKNDDAKKALEAFGVARFVSSHYQEVWRFGDYWILKLIN